MAPRASRWEILGAWLRLWTPPRDVEVPPVPWRIVVAAGAATLVVVTGGALALIAPAVDRGKERGAARDARELAARRSAEAARLRRDQRAHVARATRAARLRAAGRGEAAVRAALLAEVAASVGADARARVRRGELDGPIKGGARCSTVPNAPAGRAHWECLAVTGDVVRSSTSGVVGHTGYPFLVTASLRDLTYAWCKHNPQAGEGGAQFKLVVPLPRACTR
jgi:hypothetical protein